MGTKETTGILNLNRYAAVNFSVWSLNGGPIPSEVVEYLEDTMQKSLDNLNNEGYRLATQTTKE